MNRRLIASRAKALDDLAMALTERIKTTLEEWKNQIELQALGKVEQNIEVSKVRKKRQTLLNLRTELEGCEDMEEASRKKNQFYIQLKFEEHAEDLRAEQETRVSRRVEMERKIRETRAVRKIQRDVEAVKRYDETFSLLQAQRSRPKPPCTYYWPKKAPFACEELAPEPETVKQDGEPSVPKVLVPKIIITPPPLGLGLLG